MGNTSSTTTYLGKDPPRLAPPRPLRPPRVQHRHRVERQPSYARPENRVLPFGLPAEMPPLRHVYRHHSVPDLLETIEDTEEYELDKENYYRNINLQRSNSSSAILSGSRPVIRHQRQDSAPSVHFDMNAKIPKRYRKKYQAPLPPCNTPNSLSRQSSMSRQKRQAPAPPSSGASSPRGEVKAAPPPPPPPPPAVAASAKQEKPAVHGPPPARSLSAPASTKMNGSNNSNRSALLDDIKKAADQRNGRPPVIRPPIDKPKTPLEIFQEELSNAFSSREDRREKGELNVKVPDRTSIINGRKVTTNINSAPEKTEKSREVITHEPQIIDQSDWTPEQDLDGELDDSLRTHVKHGSVDHSVFKSSGAPSSTPSKINKKNDNKMEKFGSLKRFKKSMQNVVGSIGRAAGKLQGRKSVQSIFSSQEGYSVSTFEENADSYKVTDDEGRVWKLTQIDLDSETSEKSMQPKESTTHYSSNGEFILTNGQLPKQDQLGASLRQQELDRLQKIERELEELKAREQNKHAGFSEYDDSHRYPHGNAVNIKPSRQMIPEKHIPPPTETYITSLPKSNQMNKWMRRHTTHFDDYDSEGEDMEEPYYGNRPTYKSPERTGRVRSRQRRGVTAYEEAQMHLKRPQHFREHRHHSNPLFQDTSDEEGMHTMPVVNKNRGHQVPKLISHGSFNASTSSNDTTPPLGERTRMATGAISDYGEPDGQSSNGNNTPTSMDRKVMLDTHQCLDSPREKDVTAIDLKNPNVQVIQVPVEVHAVSSASTLPNGNAMGMTGMPVMNGVIPGLHTGLMYNPHLAPMHITNGHHQGLLQPQMATLNNGVLPTTMYPNGVLNTSIGAVPPPAPFTINSFNLNGGIPPLVPHNGLLANQMPPHMQYGTGISQPAGYIPNNVVNNTNQNAGLVIPDVRPAVPGSGDTGLTVTNSISNKPDSSSVIKSKAPGKPDNEPSTPITSPNEQASSEANTNGVTSGVEKETPTSVTAGNPPESKPVTFSEKAAALLKQVPSKSNIQDGDSPLPAADPTKLAGTSTSSSLPASKSNGVGPNFSLMAPQKFKPASQQSVCQPLTVTNSEGEMITRF
ncbi:uncharacterized protein LOC106175925 [Lingula anatina]|uniref:Uncharacterized protein LOC106175925 n=1 Tax=Lingula anatina TaxID=7574 RepID=A0A1S3JT38_LINAN|nr:uncharacterized protein LOC106175925 [Lingula anatina]XP_013413550.1 uncharacterized protein LOC106175925 [Lingula anatina]XP_013413551.1 uncharacterized protein LOC106175925 [Lingula anatina]|eukprot:XP_013413549.1 uncharacterized protein LOC106175925 [Lingula anatina]